MKKLVLFLCVCALLVAGGGSVAGSVKAKLNISHVCNDVAGGQTEYHFVALGLDDDPGAGTAVEFYGEKDGVPFGPLSAPWTKTTGNVAHYSLWAAEAAPITVTITAAVLTLPSLTLSLANPQTFETVGACEGATAVGLVAFQATVVDWLDQFRAWLGIS